MAITLSQIHENIQKTLIEKMNMLQKGQGGKDEKGEMKFGGAGGVPVIGEPVTDGTGPKFNYMFTRTVWLRMSSFFTSENQPIVIEGGELDKYERMRSGLENRPVTLNTEKDEDFNKFSGLYNPNGNQPYRPIAGVKDVNVEYKGGGMMLGATRTATVTWTCWTWEDLERLKPYFLKHGRAVLLEWGWSFPGSDISPVTFTKKNDDGISIIDDEVVKDLASKIPQKVLENKGQYDGMVGVVQNFEWSVRDDGGFDCTTTLVSLGVTVIQQALKKNVRGLMPELPLFKYLKEERTRKNLWGLLPRQGKRTTKDGIVVEEDLNPYYSFKAYMKNFARQLDYNSQSSDGAIIYTIPIERNEIKEGSGAGKASRLVEKINEKEVKVGPFCTWGWFEDNVISRFCGSAAGGTGQVVADFRSLENVYNEAGKVIRVEPVRIRNGYNSQFSPDLNKFILFGEDKKVYDNLIRVSKTPKWLGGKGSDIIDSGGKYWYNEFAPDEYDNRENPKQWNKNTQIRQFTDSFSSDKNKGILRNVYFAWDYLKHFFADEDDILSGVSRLWNDFSNTFGGIYNFKIEFDDSGKTLLIRDVGFVTKPVVDVNNRNTRSQSNTGRASFTYDGNGLFVFPVWEANSITKSQNLSAKLPQRMQMAAMYGSNKTETIGTSEGTAGSNYDDYSAWALGELNEETSEKGKRKFLDKLTNGELFHSFMKEKNFGNVDARHEGLYKSDSDTNTDQLRFVDKEIAGASRVYEEPTKYSFYKKFGEFEDGSLPVLAGMKHVVDDEMSAEIQNRYNVTAVKKEGKLDEEDVEKLEWAQKKMEDDWLFALASPTPGEGMKNAFEVSPPDAGYSTDTAGLQSGYINKKNHISQTGKHLKLRRELVDLMIMELKESPAGIVKSTDPLVPLELEIEIDGTGGIFPGNAFHSSYLPDIYFNSTVFQAVGVSHRIDSTGWYTTIKGQMRIGIPPKSKVIPPTKYKAFSDMSPEEKEAYVKEQTKGEGDVETSEVGTTELSADDQFDRYSAQNFYSENPDIAEKNGISAASVIGDNGLTLQAEAFANWEGGMEGYMKEYGVPTFDVISKFAKDMQATTKLVKLLGDRGLQLGQKYTWYVDRYGNQVSYVEGASDRVPVTSPGGG